jgi:NAD(P)-dependent dehydrogenase (short-subunit alcohol dehydrogenase family)
MKIIIVGATGTIGKKVTAELSKRHEIIKAASKSGDVKVDITSSQSIREMYKHIGKADAVICTTGNGYFGPFDTMTEEDFYIGIRSKMMGQINLVMIGKEYINDNGSFTLTSGILYKDPVRGGVGLSVVNGALHSFVIGAAIELKRGVRLNVVSPGLVEDSADALGSAFPGHIPATMVNVVTGYLKSVEGFGTGQVIDVL